MKKQTLSFDETYPDYDSWRNDVYQFLNYHRSLDVIMKTFVMDQNKKRPLTSKELNDKFWKMQILHSKTITIDYGLDN